MKDFISKFTLGFLMAQLFPGAIAALAVSFAYFAYQRDLPDGVLAAARHVLTNWNDASLAQQLFLLGLCFGLGMLIHGVHWTVLGALENGGKASIFSGRWHHLPLAVQMAFAPFRLLFEWLLLLRVSGGIDAISIEENVPFINDKLMKQHEFLEEFYLYPAQFFAHTSYALVALSWSLGLFMWRYEATGRRWMLMMILYFGISAFFTVARSQFASLFRGEWELVKKSEWHAIGAGAASPSVE